MIELLASSMGLGPKADQMRAFEFAGQRIVPRSFSLLARAWRSLFMRTMDALSGRLAVGRRRNRRRIPSSIQAQLQTCLGLTPNSIRIVSPSHAARVGEWPSSVRAAERHRLISFENFRAAGPRRLCTVRKKP